MADLRHAELLIIPVLVDESHPIMYPILKVIDFLVVSLSHKIIGPHSLANNLPCLLVAVDSSLTGKFCYQRVDDIFNVLV